MPLNMQRVIFNQKTSLIVEYKNQEHNVDFYIAADTFIDALLGNEFIKNAKRVKKRSFPLTARF